MSEEITLPIPVEEIVNDIFRTAEHMQWQVDQNEEWFQDLWNRNASEYQFYELAQSINPELTFNGFDRGWQVRNVLCEDYHAAKLEFINLMMGWY